MKRHDHIGFLQIGNTISTAKDGERIEWTVRNISIDPTDGEAGAVLIHLTNHKGQDATIGSRNLAEWFTKATWKLVEEKEGENHEQIRRL